MRRYALITVIGLAACSKDAQQATSADTPTAPDAAAEPAAPVVEQAGYVLSTAALVRQPTDDRKVKDEAGKEVSNWMATLYRGEEVVLVGQQGDWAQVRSSDGKEGWMKATAVLPAEGITMATVLEDTKTFNRPTFMAPGKTTLTGGSLLYVTKIKDEFSEVNYSSTYSAWLETAKLLTDTREVRAAAVVSRARLLEKSKDAQEEAARYWELARSQFGDTQLVQKLTADADAEAGAAPADAAAQAPDAPAQAAAGSDGAY